MSKNKIFLTGLILMVMSAQGCLRTQQINDTVSQFSTINALMQGLYETDFDFAGIKKYGDFGIGTFNDLDGEMIAVNGKFYQVKSDGKVYFVNNSMKSAFCVVKFFNADKNIDLPGETDYAHIVGLLDKNITSKNIFNAVKITGKFKYVKVRSVPKQLKPYKGLSQAANEQNIFELKDVEGTLVGFRFPGYMSDVNVEGWHFHFISKDKERGGHVLDCALTVGLVSIDESGDFYLQLSGNQDFLKADFTKVDKAALEKAEK